MSQNCIRHGLTCLVQPCRACHPKMRLKCRTYLISHEFFETVHSPWEVYQKCLRACLPDCFSQNIAPAALPTRESSTVDSLRDSPLCKWTLYDSVAMPPGPGEVSQKCIRHVSRTWFCLVEPAIRRRAPGRTYVLDFPRVFRGCRQALGTVPEVSQSVLAGLLQPVCLSCCFVRTRKAAQRTHCAILRDSPLCQRTFSGLRPCGGSVSEVYQAPESDCIRPGYCESAGCMSTVPARRHGYAHTPAG